MRLGCSRADIGGFKQVFANQMRQIAFHATNAQVDIGLAEINRLELGVAIGHVQERNTSKLANVIQTA